MAYKYLYIDDTRDQIEQGTINGLQEGGQIEVEFKFPNDWETQMNDLVTVLPGFNGVILDLRLNDAPYAEGKSANYRGSTIAQELRTLTKEKSLKDDFPIVLVSATDKLEVSLDQTSRGLFDEIIRKNDIGSRISYPAIIEKLHWLAAGYGFLNKSERSLQYILALPEEVTLDVRFVERFLRIQDQAPHIIARLLINEVIGRPGFLINEAYLAARFGIEILSEGWNTFREKFLDEFRYRGAFSTGYPRWWMSLVDQFWENNITEEYNFRNTAASKKVELIAEKTGVKNLTPIKKQKRSLSDSFWVVCKATNVPIDTIDGFLISGQDDNYPWQESEYISMQEALRPTKQYTVSPIEKPRLQKLKDALEKNEQRSRK